LLTAFGVSQHTIKAPFTGTVQEVRFSEGGFVQDGDVLLKFADQKQDKPKKK
jgi:multidrug resistance efflux pump